MYIFRGIVEHSVGVWANGSCFQVVFCCVGFVDFWCEVEFTIVKSIYLVFILEYIFGLASIVGRGVVLLGSVELVMSN